MGFGKIIIAIGVLIQGVSATSHARSLFDPTIKGRMAAIRYTAPSDGAERLVLFYFPKSIDDVKKGAPAQKTMIFLHGGGTETPTIDKAFRVAAGYMKKFLAYAEEKKVILLFPVSHFGWNAHTAYFLRHFIPFAAAQLAIDDDRLVLAGHSMGGMGITREYPWITDLFSGVLGMSAGTQPKMLFDEAIAPYFNGTPYIHINGENDTEYPTFLADSIAFEKRLREVEAQYKKKSKYELILRPFGHNYDLALTCETLDRLFENTKVRDPKFFAARFGVIHHPGDPQNQNAFPRIDGEVNQVYWVRLEDYVDPGAGKSAMVYLQASIENQRIAIKTSKDTLKARRMTLFLNSSLVDYSEFFDVTYNGEVVYVGDVPSDGILTIDLPNQPGGQ